MALEGFADPAVIGAYPHSTVRIGAAGRILALLRNARCQELVVVGPVKRPSMLDLRPDAEGVRLLARIGRAAFGGDDGLLAAVLRVLGEEGFRVLGAHEVLTEALAPQGLLTEALAPAGLLTPNGPDATAQADIARGLAVIRALGAADVGQACVVQQGIVLAVEAIEGTDAMLARAAALARPGPGGVLVKFAKPGQDRRADLPAIGPDTVRAASRAGLRGIAFEAGGTLLADAPAMAAAAREAGLFLLATTMEETP